MSPALRGVNLGGWLVSERWMTPGLYAGVRGGGERELGRQLGPAEAARRIMLHRDTFITEDDFGWIAAHGYAFVRLPVGYWLFAPDDGFVGGEEHLRQAFTWAERHGLRILLDLHGLPGSQNGWDHSGQAGAVGWFGGDHPARSVGTVTRVARAYGRHPALLGLELVNEPRLWLRAGRLLDYYAAAVAAAAEHVGPEVRIVVSDAYQARRMAALLTRRGLAGRVVLDVHLYQLFTPRDRLADYPANLRRVEHHWRRLLTRLSERVPVLVGEWTAELPGATLAEDRDTRVRRYFDAQSRIFDELAWAHSYWSYTTAADNSAWSLRHTGLVDRRT